MFRTVLYGAVALTVGVSVVAPAYSTADQGRADAWKRSYDQIVDRYCAGGLAAAQ